MKRILSGVLLILMFVSSVQAQDDNELDELINKLVDTVTPDTFQAIASQDGNYSAQIRVYDCTSIDGQVVAFEALEVTPNDTNNTEVVYSQLRYCGGLGTYGLSILKWSEDSQKIYFTDSREGTPDGISIQHRLIYRINLDENMSLEFLGNGVFSPDTSMLAVWQDKELILLETGSTGGSEVGRLSAYAPNALINRTFWLPDGNGLIYVQANSLVPPITHTYVVHVQTKDALAQTLLLETGE